MRTCPKVLGITIGVLILFVTDASASEGCSARMLRGRYAHYIQGAFGPPGEVPFGQTFGSSLPFQGIQNLDFDGKGTMTGTESIVVSGAEITVNNGKHFVPVVGTYRINSDCTGIAYICSSHNRGTIDGGPETCTGDTINTPNFVWEDFVQVTVVLAERGKKFHMLVVPPYDNSGAIRTIASTGTKVDDEDERREPSRDEH